MDPELRGFRQVVLEVQARAKEGGLDWGEVEFELVSPGTLTALAVCWPFSRFYRRSPARFYQRLRARPPAAERRLEVVLPTRPVRAYLAAGPPGVLRLAAAHALAHADFLYHNRHFRAAPPLTYRRLARHALLVRAYARRYGSEAVEAVLNASLALRSYVHPEGQDDLLAVVARLSPGLAEWQREIVAVVRAESLCLRKAEFTRLINEGWATYWHTRIMRTLSPGGGEILPWVRLQAELLRPRPPVLNPYLVGLRIFQALAAREPREHLFRIREEETDVSFLERHLTPELVKELDLFVYRARGGRWVVTAPAEEAETVRRVLIRQFARAGQPALEVTDADYRGRRELYLRHRYDGRPLAESHLARALAGLYFLWGRPVHLETATESRLLVYTADRTGVRISSVRPRPADSSLRCRQV
ncbi:MAG: SpoVR family protein [Moorellales bacterium]